MPPCRNFSCRTAGYQPVLCLTLLKELIMKKMIMAAAAACAFAFSGMAMAAELPAGWQLVQQDGENVFVKSSGVSFAAKSVPAQGATAEAIAKGVADQQGCTVDANNQLEVACPNKVNIIFDPVDANGNISFMTVGCGQADDATCQADAAEIINFLQAQGEQAQ